LDAGADKTDNRAGGGVGAIPVRSDGLARSGADVDERRRELVFSRDSVLVAELARVQTTLNDALNSGEFSYTW
jgi:hypothetical protein